MNILLVASAVGPIGSGVTGGVTDVLDSLARVLAQRGHVLDILASRDSVYDGPGRLIRIDGRLQPSILAMDDGAGIYPVIPESLIAHYWRYAFAHRRQYDVIINLCQDWLPYYMTAFFDVPVLHLPNICDENAAVSDQIRKTAYEFPGSVATVSRAQALALGIEEVTFECRPCVDLARYPFRELPKADTVIWCARICPEKGLEDAAEVARCSGKQLLVCGYVQDADYFSRITAQYADVIDYRGFLDKRELVRELGQAEALLFTHKRIEAFGLVIIEALACGTPVLTYDQGGPAEIVLQGETGFIIPSGDIAAMVKCSTSLSSISRKHCRSVCESNYGFESYGDRVENWIRAAVTVFKPGGVQGTTGD